MPTYISKVVHVKTLTMLAVCDGDFSEKNLFIVENEERY